MLRAGRAVDICVEPYLFIDRSSVLDYGLFTLLAVDSKPGLQIQRQNNLSTASWEDVAALPGSFIVNIGDMFQQWTRLCPPGSRLQSTGTS